MQCPLCRLPLVLTIDEDNQTCMNCGWTKAYGHLAFFDMPDDITNPDNWYS